MTDAIITPLRPDQQSCLAGAQPIRKRRPAVGFLSLWAVQRLRLREANAAGEHAVLEFITDNGIFAVSLNEMDRGEIDRLVSAFGDADTRRGE